MKSPLGLPCLCKLIDSLFAIEIRRNALRVQKIHNLTCTFTERDFPPTNNR
jgi:hypothetical protein